MAKVTVYMIRHGSTELNADNAQVSTDRVRGWSDIPLTKAGIGEVEATANKLKNSGIQAIVSSDLKRAVQTGQIIAKATMASLTSNPKMRPWDLGELTGKPSKDVLPIIRDYVQRKPNEAVPKGESFNSFKIRAFQGLKEALDDNRGKKLAIVTHHRNERLFEAWVKKGQPNDHSIDINTFMQPGDKPAKADIMVFDESKVGAGSAKAMKNTLAKGMRG